jgi:hypothetical protein
MDRRVVSDVSMANSISSGNRVILFTVYPLRTRPILSIARDFRSEMLHETLKGIDKRGDRSSSELIRPEVVTRHPEAARDRPGPRLHEVSLLWLSSMKIVAVAPGTRKGCNGC